jgi:predicted nuclease of predicted toxin-antitoxin system
MKLLIDMNFSPEWCKALEHYQWESKHWSHIGDPAAPDTDIMQWAKTNNYIVLTHDLDFGTLLATTNAEGPSVIQVRTQDITPDHLAPLINDALHQHQSGV